MEAINRRAGQLEENAYQRAGTIAATIVNAAPFREKNAKAWTADDFFRKKPEEQTPEQIRDFMRGFAARQNRRVKGDD